MRLITLLILLAVGGFAYSQDPVISLNVSTKDDDSGKKLAGSVVEVYKDGKLFISKNSASNGRVPTIDLPVGPKYKVVIKKPGYVPKVATFDSHYDYIEDLPPFTPFPMQTSLFKEVDGVDFEWLKTTPMIKFELNEAGQTVWDQGYTKDMQKKIEKLKNEMAEKAEEDAKKKADFDAFVKAGDAGVSKEDYEKAIQNYDSALGIFDDAEVKKKRDDAQKAFDDAQAGAELEKKFQELMTKAKDEYSSKSYEAALATYKEASDLKPAEKLPKDRIAEIEKLLADQKAQDEKFNKFVSDGDKAVGTESYDDAISNYESALAIKEDAGVKSKLEDAKKKKAEKENADAAAKELEERYNALITAADKGFDAKSYEESKSKYEEALALKPGESHPAARISEIDGILKKAKEEEDALKRLEEQYKKLVDEADVAFGEGKWQESIDTYNEALKLKAGEKHPTDQITAAKKNLADEAANAAKDEAYNKLMSDAKSLKDGEKYADAIAKYKEALNEKPGESEPTEKIKEIEKIMSDLEAANAKEAEYKKFMDNGQQDQDADDLSSALEQFKKAIGVKPGDSAAQAKIDELNKLIKEQQDAAAAEQEFNDLVTQAGKDFDAKEYTAAKKNYQKALDIKDDAGVKAKIKEIDDLIAANQNAEEQQQKYDAAMKAADEAFSTQKYEEALSKYQDAFAIKEEADAKNGIDKAKAKLAELADADAKEKEFNDLIAAGDAAFGSKDYDAALNKYRAAIKVKPDPSVSKKILDIEALVKAESENNELLGKYRAKLKEADDAFNNSSWESAKTLYADAIDIKGDEQYPKDQLDEIEKKMQEESQNEVEKQYQKILSVAQTKMDAEDYDKAIELFKRAQGMKPSDPLPQQKIDEINAIKAAKEAELADKEAFEKKFKDLVAKADGEFNSKDYDGALGDYKEALTMKPDDTHVKQRIQEINDIRNQADANAELDQKYQAAIDKADGLFKSESYEEAKAAYEEALDIKGSEQYPKDQITACNDKMQDQAGDEIEKQYQKILTVAQKKFDEENYDKAIELYERAKGMKPSDPLPQNKIDEINQLLADMASEKEKRDRFNKLIQDADTQFEQGKFEKALPIYMKALDIFKEQYPTDQVEKCREKMKGDSSGINKQYDKLIKKADEYFNAATYDKAKNLYQRAVKLKPSDKYPKDQLKEIDRILNPPKKLTADSGPLKDYGPAINEKPLDIEAMLREAEEQNRFNEYEAAYSQREEANAANKEWTQDGYNEGFITRQEAIKIEEDLIDMAGKGDVGRAESRESVVQWRDDLSERKVDDIDGQENDIQYQNKRIEAMTVEIAENTFDNDKPREEYLLDVEKIKLEIVDKNKTEVDGQENIIQQDKVNIEKVVESHVTHDPHNDDARQEVLILTENQNIDNINMKNENSWDQEDEVMNTRVESELLRDDIAANQLDDDVNRVESLKVIEEINISYADREKDDSDSQLNNNMTTRNNAEDLRQDIIDNKMGNDIPRQDMEVFVVEKEDEFATINVKNNQDQTDVVMNADVDIENIEILISEENRGRNEQREGYEEVVVDIQDEINKKDNELADDNIDKGMDMKDYAEKMLDDKTAKDKEGYDKQVVNEDNQADMMEDHIDHLKDDEIQNEESLNESQDYAESLKDLDVTKITPELENELGKKFPEGVTEESFAINDSQGVLKSYVVRRIVVSNGSGKVYEKVSTRYGHESYTRNGQPISEYQWNDETSSAQVGRN